MTVKIELQINTQTKPLPSPALFRKWVKTALDKEQKNIELTLRLVDIEEMCLLNHKYRHKSGPTNVLSFPADIDPIFKLPILGDIVICASVVEKEASEQGKELFAHWAHMVIHGTLHLLGFDHQTPAEAVEMETIEMQMLDKLGFPSPYTKNLKS